MRTERPGVKWMRAGLGAASLLAAIWFAPVASAQEPKGVSGSDVAETGKKLSNPLSDVWALFTRFDASFADGDVNQGDAKVGSRMLFQPILPVPLHGTGPDVLVSTTLENPRTKHSLRKKPGQIWQSVCGEHAPARIVWSRHHSRIANRILPRKAGSSRRLCHLLKNTVGLTA